MNEDVNFTYQYDNNGNTTRKTAKIGGAVTTYEYDAENKLVRVVGGGTTSTYKYDGLGRRVERDVVGATTTVQRYVYDNEDILLELDGSNNIVARYTHGPGIDEPLVTEKAGQNYFYHADGLSSITEITNQSGTPVQRYTYSSFGEIESQLDPNFIQPYTFTSREFDAETGLYFYRVRTYDRSTGRFLQQDPMGFADGSNFYAYVSNNPTTFIDPWGLAKHDPNSQYCQSLRQKIENIRKKIQQRYEDLENNPRGLPAYIGPGERLRDTQRGHRILITIDEARLRELEKKYQDECGGDDGSCKQCTNAAAAAGVVVGGYLLYRCIRLLPSLAPPLWPTLPANLIIP